MGLFFLIMLVAIWALWRLSSGGAVLEGRKATSEDALEVLRRRYAAGEIDSATYRQQLRDLEV